MPKLNKPVKIVKKNIAAETVAYVLTSRTYTEAAQRLGISVSALYERFDRHPEIREQVAKMSEDMPKQAHDILRRGAVRASEVFIEKLEDKDKQMEAAKEVLDRVGISGKGPSVAIQNNGQLSMGLLIENYEDDKTT